MTLIQNKKTITKTRLFRPLLAGMLALVIGGVVSLVVLYNQTVAAQHAARDLNERTLALEGQNADRESQLMSQLDSQSLAAFAAARGLVEDRTPRYLQAEPEHTWAFAGRF